MCGIIGYTGSENTLPRLLGGLTALEYRGYDSAGIAFFKNNRLDCIKCAGRIDALKAKVSEELFSNCGIGHTRWATHGEPNDVNSHPHGTDNLYIVHNGIIENYAELKQNLEKCGYNFVSETDTEIAAKLIDYYYLKLKNPIKALRLATKEFRGSYAISVIFQDYPGKIFAARQDNPILAAVCDNGAFITSDISAILSYTKTFVRPKENEIVVAEGKRITIYDESDNVVERDFEEAVWNREEAEKGGFPFYMLKEIHEEPDSLIKTLRGKIKERIPHFDSPLLEKNVIKKYSHIHIVACGTAYHAGLIAKYAIEDLARIRVSVSLASEFRYNSPIFSDNDLVIVISQSGETADTLAALRLAKDNGVKTLGIVNVVGSAIARESDSVIYTRCGPEIAVASTKAYSVQCALLYLIAIHIAYSLNKLSKEDTENMTSELLNDIPKAVGKVIEQKDGLCEIADKFKNYDSIFFIGRGIDHALCCEAALKCKEISYIHCEAYAAGELKHGTISLVTDGTPVCAVMTQEYVVDKMINNIKEVKARGGHILLFTKDGLTLPEEIADTVIYLPKVRPLFMPLVCATAAQLLAYYLSFNLGIDVDKPRNLAKSVTVE